MSVDKRTRREFVCNTAVAFGGLVLAPVSASKTKHQDKQKDAEVPPDLVAVLRQQHEVGRGLTRQILQGATEAGFRSAQTRQQVAGAMRAYLRLYRPHAAREDTVLFPALHDVYSQREYRELGEQFEDRKRKLFGEKGFEKVVAQVAEIEKTLGIFDLARFSHPE